MFVCVCVYIILAVISPVHCFLPLLRVRPPACRQIVLSVTQDEFFRGNKDANYGDLGVAIKNMLDDYTRSRGGR